MNLWQYREISGFLIKCWIKMKPVLLALSPGLEFRLSTWENLKIQGFLIGNPCNCNILLR